MEKDIIVTVKKRRVLWKQKCVAEEALLHINDILSIWRIWRVTEPTLTIYKNIGL